MSSFAPKASLESMPPELLRMMLPVLKISPDATNTASSASLQRWLPIKPRWIRGDYYYFGLPPSAKEADLHLQNSLKALRSLSNTCRKLRAFVLPELWATVDVATIDELGRLRETLRVSPSLALHIRQFSFLWQPLSRYDLYSVPKLQSLESSFHAESGPDGQGPDPLIKTMADLNDAIVEVASQFKGLEAFTWTAREVSMPQGMCNALEKLTTLTSFRAHLMAPKEKSSFVPLWKVAGRVQYLSLDAYIDANEVESDFETLVTFEPPSEPRETPRSAQKLLADVLCRTLIAAAQGKQLKRIECTFLHCTGALFAMRQLMPYWVSIEKWGSTIYCDGYVAAACSLREILAHASLWLDAPSDMIARQDRTLTPQEIQSLDGHFQAVGVPWMHWSEVEWESTSNDSDGEGVSGAGCVRPHTDLYLPWLAEDAELAQSVSDAWNTIVNCGKVDVVKCRCDKCQATL